MKQSDRDNHQRVIDWLYPDLSEEDRRKAFENLDRYIDLSLRMYQRIQADPRAYELFKTWLSSRQQRPREHADERAK